MKILKTSAEVIDRLGGNTIVSRLFDVTPNAVGNWRVRGFPPETFIALNTALTSIGHSAPFSLWQMHLPKTVRGKRKSA